MTLIQQKLLDHIVGALAQITKCSWMSTKTHCPATTLAKKL